ncbi:hypothetical protein SAMN05444161_2262 [Rhizobiales bacterium GAS191]|nr:hypothetical protein SAMN05519103_01376 [Rhizobiales bacterium GAS113]SEC98721.1 hypothetical protein SAMN05444161_2262 [Rhizobiales bacterium GAS191]
MRPWIILPTFLALALFVAIPASTKTHAMSIGAVVTEADDSVIVLSAVSAAARKACHHFRNRTQRHKCEHEHM